MRDILKNKEFCAVLDSVSAFWRGKNVLWWEDSPYWRLEYLKEDLEHLLLSTSYSKLCKLFMLVVTGADYAESTPGGLLMPDVSVFGDGKIPDIRTELEFLRDIRLGKFDDVTLEGLRRIVKAGNNVFCSWINRLDDAGLKKAVLALPVLRQENIFTDTVIEEFVDFYSNTIPTVKDSAGNGALWYVRPYYRMEEIGYFDFIFWVHADRAPMADEVFKGFAQELIDLGCDPYEEGKYGLSFDDLRVLGNQQGVGFNFVRGPVNYKDRVSRYFWYIVEWCQWKVNMGRTPIWPDAREE